MLSIFPEFLNFSLFGVFLIRIVVGLVLLYISIEILFRKKDKVINEALPKDQAFLKYSLWLVGTTALLSASFLIIGFLTQVAAIVSSYLFLNIMVLDSQKNRILNQNRLFYITMSAISITILVLGPGLWSIDLPL